MWSSNGFCAKLLGHNSLRTFEQTKVCTLHTLWSYNYRIEQTCLLSIWWSHHINIVCTIVSEISCFEIMIFLRKFRNPYIWLCRRTPESVLISSSKERTLYRPRHKKPSKKMSLLHWLLSIWSLIKDRRSSRTEISNGWNVQNRPTSKNQLLIILYKKWCKFLE